MIEARQLPLPFDEPLPYEAADFIEAASNAAARAALDRKQGWVNGRLVIWGEAGSGKTHLLRLWAEREGAARLSAPSLREAVQQPRQDLAIEDIDALISEPALLHTLNAAQAAGHHVLLTSRAPPARLDFRLPDLASRLRASLTIQIEPAEDALLEALLIRLCAARQISLPPQLQNYLLTRLPRRAAVLHEAVARLDRATLALGVSPTRAMASLILADLCVTPEEPLRERHSHNAPGFL
ncbi:MAG TPA: DnaA/Hda family protein [Acetobacteraceae bacterium]|nr:DnaA/Hda family protein [Acetobacteraceae bacterium]